MKLGELKPKTPIQPRAHTQEGNISELRKALSSVLEDNKKKTEENQKSKPAPQQNVEMNRKENPAQNHPAQKPKEVPEDVLRGILQDN